MLEIVKINEIEPDHIGNRRFVVTFYLNGIERTLTFLCNKDKAILHKTNEVKELALSTNKFAQLKEAVKNFIKNNN